VDYEATAKNFKKFFKESGYTIIQLQKMLCLSSHQAIYYWFSGKRFPSIENLVELAFIFNTTVDELIIVNYIQGGLPNDN
jgi:transcriptional regulator with XRE-family HTH domain